MKDSSVEYIPCSVVCRSCWQVTCQARWQAEQQLKGRFTHNMPCPCHAHAVPLPCRAAKLLKCVFPIWFTQCVRVWFTLAMPCPYRAHAMLWPCRSSQGHGTARPSRDGLWATCRFRLLPATTRNSTKIVIGSIQISSQRSIPTTVKSDSSTRQKRRSVKLLD